MLRADRTRRRPLAARWQGDRAYWLMMTYLAGVALLGGASRSDEPVLLVLRPLAALMMLGWLLACPPADWRRVRTPLLLLCCLAAVMLLQLVPLPPAIWLLLPGHARFLAAAQVAGMAQPWRPITIAPQFTWNALFALLVPAAGLVGMAHVGPRYDRRLVLAILAIAVVSAIAGLLQVSGTGAISLYRITTTDLPVGLFTNRNHQAVFLGACLPLLAAVARERGRPSALWIAACTALVFLATIFATGSRSGLLTAAIGLALAAWIVLRGRRAFARPGRPGRPATRRAVWAAVAAALLVVALAIARGLAFERLFVTNVGSEQRLQLLPIVLKAAMDYFPFGTGFGTFDRAFRIVEPDWALHQSFFNHAHNDLAELLMTGGLAAVLVLAAFAIWFVRLQVVWWHTNARGAGIHLALSGLMILLLVSSLTDYPLRTPLLATLAAVCCVLLFPDRSDDPAIAA